MKDSIPDRIANFLPADNPQARTDFLILFVFGLLVSDGHVSWTYCSTPDNVCVRYDGFQLAARDRYIMPWLLDRLREQDCTILHIYIRRDGLSRLKVGTTQQNNDLLRHGLQLMEQHGIPLDGKLQFLRFSVISCTMNVLSRTLLCSPNVFVSSISERKH